MIFPEYNLIFVLVYVTSICVVCLVHEKEKTDLQCYYISFDAGTYYTPLQDNSSLF